MLEAEVREALLYGCSTWTLLHSRVWPTPYPAPSTPTVCRLPEEPTFQQPVILLDDSGHDRMRERGNEHSTTPTPVRGFFAPPKLDRLPRALLQGSLVNGSNRYRQGRPEKSWWNCLTDGLKAFEISEGECETLANDRSMWCERVSQGAEMFIPARRNKERKITFNRPAPQAEKHASTLPRSPLRLSLSVSSECPHLD